MTVSAASAVRDLNRQMADIGKRMRGIVLDSHVSACNRVAVSVRAQAVREVRSVYPGFKASEARATMQIIRATREKPTAVVRVRGSRTPLVAFSARQNKTGVSVHIRTRKTVKGAFIATMKSGHRGVFTRSGRFGRRGNPKLERIKQLFSLSLPQALEQEQILSRLRPFAAERYKVELAREVKFRTSRVSY